MLNWQIIHSSAIQIASDTGATPVRPFGLDMTIESMSTQKFSVAIFFFLIFGIAIFTAFVFAYLKLGREKKLKRGEKILFAWILLGVVVAIAFGASQLLFGNLF